MTIAEWCIFASVMLYLLTIAPIKWLGFREFDNANPRDPAFYRQSASRPRPRRASERHRDVSVFRRRRAAGGISRGPQNLINELAVLFLIVRIAYVFTYLGDRPTLRSILWSIGFAINVGIFFLPMIRAGCRRERSRAPDAAQRVALRGAVRCRAGAVERQRWYGPGSAKQREDYLPRAASRPGHGAQKHVTRSAAI